MEKILTIIMAGGLGERLQPLTKERSKAATPFGGKYRIIDFTLSNCVNSGIRQIYVLTQHRADSLLRHIQEGWGISSAGLGDFIYPVPAQQKQGSDWYRGTADAVRQNLNLVKDHDFEDILILSGDHIYKMNYTQMWAFHQIKDAGFTISAIRVKKEQAANSLGVLEIDREYRLIGFEEKPADPKEIPGAPGYCLASMGVYIVQIGKLFKALKRRGNDFGMHIIPKVMAENSNSIFVYDYEERNKIDDFEVKIKEGKKERVLVERTMDSLYWKDIGTLDSYYEASMDLIKTDPPFNLYGEKWPFRTWQRPLPPSKSILGGITQDSIVSDGCIINGGRVTDSILSPGVLVGTDAIVEQSIIFDDVTIEPTARVKRAIIDKGAQIKAGASVGYNLEEDRKRGCVISEDGVVVVPRGIEVSRFGPTLFD